MEKIIVFGAGSYGKRYITTEGSQKKIIAIADNNWEIARRGVFGHSIISPNDILSYEFDKIVIAIDDGITVLYSTKDTDICYMDGIYATDAIIAQLLSMGVPKAKIKLHNVSYLSTEPRVNFVAELKFPMPDDEIQEYAVAECGVNRGHFAAHINRIFPKSKLYLFDTFTGQTADDIQSGGVDSEMRYYENIEAPKLSSFTAEEVVLARCPHPEQVTIHTGWVPETFKEVPGDTAFCYVNLDMDVYKAQLAALRYFAPRMCEGGVIMLHDYYHHRLTGVKLAVEEFRKERKCTVLPVNDDCSVALVLTGK